MGENVEQGVTFGNLTLREGYISDKNALSLLCNKLTNVTMWG